MRKLLSTVRAMNPLSRFILRGGLSISFLMFALCIVYTYMNKTGGKINTLLQRVANEYPLLTIMVFALSIVGALLIDIYTKTRSE
jgi:hypothetical protein